MKRSERQHALVDLLRANAEHPVSVSRLAARFEVSTRTIERDIRALQEAGVPIYGREGRAGGYAIGRDYSLPPLGLTLDEAMAVLGGLTVMSGSPFAPHARTAMDKVIAVLPADRREASRALATRVASLAPEQPTTDEVAAVVRDVVVEPRVVELVYVSPATGERTERAVEPLGLIDVRGNWILIGWCRLRGAVRGFRTDAVESIRRTEEVPPIRDSDPLADDLSRWEFLTYGG
ncbi:helix-turn-helix transcriptional regulator [Mobilicoccus massiliensis]|uniref:helix-turn-helix transcriptional regulator n=1 Tax=Mobilicoccus massiliensis TaxID=1522310 RepID=UPI00059129AF|nr:WYL domain-containing protein [Mobilicoccus massiliensis]